METKDRQSHIDFIKDDVAKRGETLKLTEIQFLGALYFVKVKKEPAKRYKTVVYSAAKNLLEGYRKIQSP